MRFNALGAACLVVGGLLLIGAPSSGQAQSGSHGRYTVAADVGTRIFTSEPDSLHIGKFEEYRDLARPVVAERLLLNYTGFDGLRTYTLGGTKLFERDQDLWLQARHLGLYDFHVDWNRIPHTYSTTGRSPGLGDDFNTLPIPRPDSVAWQNARYIGAIRQQWDPVRASLAFTPTEKLDSKIDYVRIGKSGGIPLSLSFNASSGPQREFIAPVDQTVQDFRVQQGFASSEKALGFIRSFLLQASYAYSMFQNNDKSVLVDNPMLAVNTSTIGAATSRASLPPDNRAQTATLTAALGLPARTRVTASMSRSWMTQNDAFLPQTNNDSLKVNANYALLALPRNSLDGKVQTSTINLSASSRPLTNLTLSAKYRSYDRKENTALFHIRAMAISDRSVNLNDTLTSELDPFTKTNTDLSATYQVVRGVAASAAYLMENWTHDAEVRNLAKTKEKGPRVSLDVNALEWLALHGSYSTARRRGDDYTEAGTEIIGFRRFDLADRNRARTTAVATVTPVSQLDVSLDYALTEDKFPNSQYGTQSDRITSKGIDVDWAATPRVGLSGGYSRDDGKNVLNSRYRTGAAGSVTYDNPTYKWTSTNADKNTTAYVSLSATLVPNKLDLFASASAIDAHYKMTNVNPTTPTGGTATQNLAATVEDWPEITQNLKPVTLSLRYRYSKDWAVTAGFRSEQYEQVDFRTGMPLFAPYNALSGNLPASVGTLAGTTTGQYHFLSNAYLPYTANWLTLTVSFHPSSESFRRVAMGR